MTASSEIIGLFFMIMTILLFISIALLIWRLQVKLKYLRNRGESDAFGKEIWNVIAIMLIFSSSFLIRWLFDSFIYERLFDSDSGSPELYCQSSDGDEMVCSPYFGILWLLITQYPWDLIPIAVIFIFHHANFRTSKDKSEVK